MTIFLKGLGIKGFRSFGPETQYLYPFSQINLIAGQNNSGKSNVLRFIEELKLGLSNIQNKRSIEQSMLNIHKGKNASQMRFCLPIDVLETDLIINRLVNIRPQLSSQLTVSMSNITNGLKSNFEEDVIWFEYDAANFEIRRPANDDVIPAGVSTFKIAREGDWVTVWNVVTNYTGGTSRDWIPPVIAFMSPLNYLSLPDVHSIPALRRIGEKSSVYSGFNGDGIIQRLAELERPNLENLHLKEDFRKINNFLQEVTENSSAVLEIPSDKSTILVDMDGRTLPIQSLGTGIHEVIILAAAATTLKNSIVCLEEPELHLHPRLQKRLINYLITNTDNQYFISTHSAHLLDCKEASVFHVGLENGESKVSLAISSSDKANICHDLGYSPSDLMQTNAIIWVEGPSDRIYLSSWITQTDPSLVEGVDYSIMFYGGRLLSHLSANDPTVNDFISLRRLNRHIAIVIDSDRESKNHKLNPTKIRVRDEFDGGPGFAWITYGREIENYIEPAILENSIKTIHKRAQSLVSSERFAHPYFYRDSANITHKDIDKVAVARHIIEQRQNLSRFDLKEKLNQLVLFIRNANNHLLN